MKVLGPILALALAACVAPADPSTSQPVLDPDELAPAPQTGPTYHRETRELCRDLGIKFCSASVPAPQCPPNPQGQPCSLAQPFCYKTISAQFYDYYSCS